MIKQLDDTLEIEMQKGMHWNNLVDQKRWRLLVYPSKIVKTALILFIKFAS